MSGGVLLYMAVKHTGSRTMRETLYFSRVSATTLMVSADASMPGTGAFRNALSEVAVSFAYQF